MDAFGMISPPAAARDRWRRVRTAVTVCNWLYLAVAAVAAVLLRFGDAWWPATFLMFAPLWVFALPVGVLIPAALVWRRRALVPGLLAVVLVLGPVTDFCVQWPTRGDTPVGGSLRLRVLTCNMHYGNPDPARLNRLIDETDPDVIVLQEWLRPRQLPAFGQGRWHLFAVNGQFLASRHTIRRSEIIGSDTDNPDGSAARYELVTDRGVVTFFSVHFASPRDALFATSRGRAGGPALLGANSALRRRQSENLAKCAAEVVGPVVLAGDFNTPPQSVLFRGVWAGYADAFSAAGWGWGYTFRADRTMTRIDHVLTGPGWRCEACRVGPNVGSPHRPVVADLVWTQSAD
jgi:endonuclease/exonuclease/phosphatase (EEP) superfamily protein YafD